MVNERSWLDELRLFRVMGVEQFCIEKDINFEKSEKLYGLFASRMNTKPLGIGQTRCANISRGGQSAGSLTSTQSGERRVDDYRSKRTRLDSGLLRYLARRTIFLPAAHCSLEAEPIQELAGRLLGEDPRCAGHAARHRACADDDQERRARLASGFPTPSRLFRVAPPHVVSLARLRSISPLSRLCCHARFLGLLGLLAVPPFRPILCIRTRMGVANIRHLCIIRTEQTRSTLPSSVQRDAPHAPRSYLRSWRRISDAGVAAAVAGSLNIHLWRKDSHILSFA
ncbi:hypothetical protein CERSUDRAFT_127326 [Gelatoporia subvermispora B]|uniref:Uncharacterized protein n=1 Tax=Ceriporiopsis subvermispora (strain B) TaxID=914234 RepID=M2QHQ5_CERS8|nr:hypothetical protein CERSUDRAFT_127326 [Gelatoporia subvermispora B]